MLESTKDSVKEYYGQTLKTSSDLQTDACCTAEDMPEYAKPILAQVHDEVLMKYYGCGIVIPEELGNCTILDLGSGSGRDCYVLSKLVGEKGRVVGVDMTEEQLDVAKKHIPYMTEKYGYQKPNVEFLKGEIEKINQLGLEPESVDVIISNCVVNLCEDKQAVLDQAFELLKEGGEFYFSDVYADRRIPVELAKDPVLYGECLSGALYWNDFQKMARRAGFQDVRKVTSRPLTIENKEAQEKLGNIQFRSITYRLFKFEGLEEDCEDYGQAVRYKGSAEHHTNAFQLDEDHRFEAGRIYPVCGNTYNMLNKTRFREHFDFWGDFSHHYGLFKDCGTSPSQDSVKVDVSPSCC